MNVAFNSAYGRASIYALASLIASARVANSLPAPISYSLSSAGILTVEVTVAVSSLVYVAVVSVRWIPPSRSSPEIVTAEVSSIDNV